MTAGDGDAGLGADVSGALEHLAQALEAQLLDRPGDEAQRAYRLCAHGVDVAQGIGGGDAAIVERVVDDGREDIDGLDQRQIVAQAEHRRVVGASVADQQAWFGHIR